jgi:hypothetical protein
MSLSNFSLNHQRGREKRGKGLPEGKKTATLSRLSSGEEEEGWLRPVRAKRCSGRPFYRRPRGGERQSWADAGEVAQLRS